MKNMGSPSSQRNEQPRGETSEKAKRNIFHPFAKNRAKTSRANRGLARLSVNSILHPEPDTDQDAVANKKVTNTIVVLRSTVFILLLITAVLVSVGVFLYTKNNEYQTYKQELEDDALRVIDRFHRSIEHKLSAANSLATQMTSYALDTNATFPFVTLPHFAVRGSDLRVQSDGVIVHWMPLVTDDNRLEWEDYAMKHRSQIDEAFQQDLNLRNRQDQEFGYDTSQQQGAPNGRALWEERPEEVEDETLVDTPAESQRVLGELAIDPSLFQNETVLEDGSQYHPRLWSIGSVYPRADFPYNTSKGPYLPLWQRSPINAAKQALLNMEFSNTLAIGRDLLDILIESRQAIMARAIFPIPYAIKQFKSTLEVSQYRHDGEFAVEDPQTFFVYPVFDSFDGNRELVGALATNFYWKLFFEKILQSSSTSLVCVLTNSFNQSLSYLVQGPDVLYLGPEDFHDPSFDDCVQEANVNDYVRSLVSPENQAYTAVSLNLDYGRYKLSVYPYEGADYTMQAWYYVMVVAFTFLFTSIIFIFYASSVEKRQVIVMNTAINNAEKAATTAQEMNEFLSHEVRNPISAAISACSFVRSSLKENESAIVDKEFERSLKDDVNVISSSLSFVSDFLRSMLDIHRAAGNKMQIHLADVDVRTDVLEPVSSMFFQKDELSQVTISVECPPNLVLQTDCLRLKQIIMNLGRNAAKFVSSGFIKFCAQVTSEHLEIAVEDSGPGLPPEKQQDLFKKFQTSLDSLGQGTGLGLSLCKSLVDLLGAEILLDHDYNSGLPGSPGARFVVRFDRSHMSSALDHDTDSTSEFPLKDEPKVGLESCVSYSTLPQNVRVLFVDDDLMLRRLFSRGIKRVAPDWEISEAANGEAAIAILESGEIFDLIFMDQYMASTEKQLLGTETVRILRSKGLESIICGLSANDIEQTFLQAGANYFIMKPMPSEKQELTRELLRITKGIRHREENPKEEIIVVDGSKESQGKS